ncbi:DNA-directed RNA polymerase subunit RPC12/RpoP [Mesorhizobium jarvisii]
MPEQPETWPRGVPWRLTNAHDAGQVAGIRCGRCNIKRFYKPLDLRELIGNVTIGEVKEKMRCQKCGSKEWMDAELFHPTGEQAHAIRFRRLKEIRWERRVVWRDE